MVQAAWFAGKWAPSCRSAPRFMHSCWSCWFRSASAAPHPCTLMTAAKSTQELSPTTWYWRINPSANSRWCSNLRTSTVMRLRQAGICLRLWVLGSHLARGLHDSPRPSPRELDLRGDRRIQSAASNNVPLGITARMVPCGFARRSSVSTYRCGLSG